MPEFNAASYEQIEAEVLKVFNKSDIITPDEVRGNYSTLSDAVLVNSRYASVPQGICRLVYGNGLVVLYIVSLLSKAPGGYLSLVL